MSCVTGSAQTRTGARRRRKRRRRDLRRARNEPRCSRSGCRHRLPVRCPCRHAQAGEVSTGSPADLAGLRAGDRIVVVDGQRVGGVQRPLRRDPESEATPARSVDRDGRPREIKVTPTHYFDANWAIGFRPRARPSATRRARHRAAFDRTWEVTRAIGAVFDGSRREGRRDISEPGGDHRVRAGGRRGLPHLPSAARVHQPLARLLNPLPAPLDGGHIAFSLVEGSAAAPSDARSTSGSRSSGSRWS